MCAVILHTSNFSVVLLLSVVGNIVCIRFKRKIFMTLINDPKYSQTSLRERVRYFMIVVLILVSPLLVLVLLFVLSVQPNPNMYEDLDPWCDKYYPELNYTQCLDKAGLIEN